MNTVAEDFKLLQTLMTDWAGAQSVGASFYQLNHNAICTVEFSGVISSCNPSFSSLLSKPQNQLVGSPFIELFDINYRLTLSESFLRVKLGIADKIEVSLNSNTGVKLFTRCILIPALVNNQYIGFICVLIDLTRKHQLLNSLKQSEEHYRLLVEYAPVAIIVHQNGLICFANKTAEKILNTSDLVGSDIYSFVHPDYVALAQQRASGLVTGNVLPFVTMALRCSKGLYLNVDVGSMGIVYAGTASTLTILRDISAEVKAEEVLRKKEAKYRLIADNMTDLVCLLNAKGKVKYASPSHQHILGYSPSLLEGTTFYPLLHPDDLAGIEAAYKEMVEKNIEIRIEFRCLSSSGQWIWLEAKGGVANCETQSEYDKDTFLLVSRNINERKQLEEQLSFLAFHDSLTKAPNRRYFMSCLQNTIDEYQQSKKMLAVLFMDLDKFKQINDHLGHDVGDELLVSFYLRVKSVLRNRDVIARLGGDEFVILLPDLGNEQDVIPIIERILNVIQAEWQILNHQFSTTSSIGVALYPKNATSAQELLKKADIALYQAKQNGRNQYMMIDD